MYLKVRKMSSGWEFQICWITTSPIFLGLLAEQHLLISDISRCMNVQKLLKALKACNLIVDEILDEPGRKCSDARKMGHSPSLWWTQALAFSRFGQCKFSRTPVHVAFQWSKQENMNMTPLLSKHVTILLMTTDSSLLPIWQKGLYPKYLVLCVLVFRM